MKAVSSVILWGGSLSPNAPQLAVGLFTVIGWIYLKDFRLSRPSFGGGGEGLAKEVREDWILAFARMNVCNVRSSFKLDRPCGQLINCPYKTA